MSDLDQVTLPDGKVVHAPNSPQPWWTEDGGVGYIDPKMLIPNPRQPREDMNSSELEELQLSVTERGVREPIAVTPRELAPWVKLKPEQAALPFIIVSGHRRDRTAITAKLPAVPVRVIVYANEADFELDTSILNKGRAELTALEEGREIFRLHDLGVPIEKLVKAFGYKSAPSLYSRMNLTRLAPQVQALLDPKLPTKQQLPSTTGGHLGSIGVPTAKELEELCVLFKSEVQAAGLFRMTIYADLCTLDDDARRFELQKILLCVIRTRRLSAARSIELITEHKLSLESAGNGRGRKSDRFQPRKRKEILGNLASVVEDSTVIDWLPEEFERIFEDSSAQEVEDYRVKMHGAQSLLADIELLLQRLVKQKKEASGRVTQLPRKRA